MGPLILSASGNDAGDVNGSCCCHVTREQQQQHQHESLWAATSQLIRPDTIPIESRYILKEIIGQGSFGTVRKVQVRNSNISNRNIDNSSSADIDVVCAGRSGWARKLHLLPRRRQRRQRKQQQRCLYYGCKTISKSSVLVVKNNNSSNNSNSATTTSLQEEIANMEACRGHPHLLEFKEAFEDTVNNSIHIVTELLEGGDLYDCIEERRRQRTNMKSSQRRSQSKRRSRQFLQHQRQPAYFEDGDAAYMVRNMLDALHYCHEIVGIVHRDLKASNIMFVKSSVGSRNVRNIKIIDFGLSKKVENNCNNDGVSGCVGTPYYVAPEVVVSSSSYYTTKVDIWSIGVLAYLILSFDLPFQGKDEIETIRMLQNVEEYPPSYSSPRWNHLQNSEPEAIEFCKLLLQKDPLKRPTAREAMNHPWIVKWCSGTGGESAKKASATTTTSSSSSWMSTPSKQQQQPTTEEAPPPLIPNSDCSSQSSFNSNESSPFDHLFY